MVTPSTATLSSYSRENSVRSVPPTPGRRTSLRKTFRSSRVSMMGMIESTFDGRPRFRPREYDDEEERTEGSKEEVPGRESTGGHRAAGRGALARRAAEERRGAD